MLKWKYGDKWMPCNKCQTDQSEGLHQIAASKIYWYAIAIKKVIPKHPTKMAVTATSSDLTKLKRHFTALSI